MVQNRKQKRIYFDYASTTPVDPKVALAMRPFLSEHFFNPSSLYREGIYVKSILDESRKKVATELSGHPDEVVFTGSGTESNNIAILSVLEGAKKYISRPQVIVSSIEHPSIIGLKEEIERRGGYMSIVSVDEFGIVDMDNLKKLLNKNTAVVSVMYANNEIGTVEPIRNIAKIVRNFRKSKKTNSSYPYFHTDASQASNYLSLNVQELGVDLLSLDGSKIYGPKGVGALWFRRGVELTPTVFGGGQEKGIRSGTENLASIVGFATALRIAQATRAKESKRLSVFRDKLISSILKRNPKSQLNGDPKERLPNNVNICFPNLDAEHAVIIADSFGILCSTASSCKNLSEEDLHSDVIEALGKGRKCARSSIRFSLGRYTKADDVNTLINSISKIVSQANLV